MFCSALQPTGERAGWDWQLSQAEVYWIACWWLGLHSISHTKAFVPGHSDTPAASGLSVFTASLYVNSLLSLIMCEEGKCSLSGQSGTSSLLMLRGSSNYLSGKDLGLFFPFFSKTETCGYSTSLRNKRIDFLWECDAIVGFCFCWFVLCTLRNKFARELFQRIKDSLFTQVLNNLYDMIIAHFLLFLYDSSQTTW